MKRPFRGERPDDLPDLQTQYESLLDTVWRCESRARLQALIEARMRFEAVRLRRRGENAGG